MEAKGCTAEEKVAAIVEIVNGELLASRRVEHLVEGQLDKNVTFQAAWRRGGFAEDDMDDHGVCYLMQWGWVVSKRSSEN